MKRFLTLILITASCSMAMAQDEPNRIAIKAAYSSTWLLNKNVSDKNDMVDYASSFGPSFGIQYIRMLSEKVGLDIEILMSNHVQKYDGEDISTDLGITTTTTLTLEDRLKYLDIPILLRTGDGGGLYFEFGPQFSFLMNAEEDFGMTSYGPGFSFGDSYSDKDVKDDFNDFIVSGVIGVGIDLALTDNLSLGGGLRLAYGFSDASTEYSKEEFNAKSDAEALSANSAIIHTTGADLSQGANQEQFGYEKTARVSGGIHLALTYRL